MNGTNMKIVATPGICFSLHLPQLHLGMHSILLHTYTHTHTHTHTHTNTHVHVRVHRFISKKVYTIQFVNGTSNAKQQVVIRCTVDAWEFEYSKLIGSVYDVFMFKQEVNSRVMQYIRLESNWKAIPRDLLNCPSFGQISYLSRFNWQCSGYHTGW